MMTSHQFNLFDLPPAPPAHAITVDVRAHTRRVCLSALPETLPYAKHSDTSKIAAELAAPKAEDGRARVLVCLRRYGPQTNEQVSDRTGIPNQTVCPRMFELRGEIGKWAVKDSGRMGKTKAGYPAHIWEAVK
jgi:hypothetical protein